MRTEQNLAALVSELEGNCGDLFAACKACSVSPSFVRKWMADDKLVAERLEEAVKVGALAIESEVIRRGVRGVHEDIYYQGEVVGEKKVYSDGLLTLLAKKRLKETYGDDPAQTNVNIQNNVNLMPRAKTYEEWLTMVSATEAQAALPAPDNVVEVDFTPVLSPEEDPRMADIL